jgi:hypothetical protein
MQENTVSDSFAHHTAQAGALAMHDVECGRGLPRLQLHCLPQHWRTWRRVLPRAGYLLADEQPQVRIERMTEFLLRPAP